MNAEQSQLTEQENEEKNEEAPAAGPMPLQQQLKDDGDDIHLYTRVQMVDVHFRVIQRAPENAPERLVMIGRQHLEDIDHFLQYLAESSGLSKEDCSQILQNGYENLMAKITGGPARYYGLTTPMANTPRMDSTFGLDPQILKYPQQQQQQQQQNMPNMQNEQAYQAQLMRAQFAQMQMAKQQNGETPQGQLFQDQPSQHQGIQQMKPQQQQMPMAAAQGGSRELPSMQPAQRYHRLYQQRLLHLRYEMSQRVKSQYGPPSQYPPDVAQKYGQGLEQHAKAWVQDLMRRERREREAAQYQQDTQETTNAQ